MQIKTMMIHHHTLLEWLKSKVVITPGADDDVEKLGLLHIATENVKWYKHYGK